MTMAPQLRASLPLSKSDHRITATAAGVGPISMKKKKKKKATASALASASAASTTTAKKKDPSAFPGLRYYSGKRELFDIIQAEGNRRDMDIGDFEDSIVKSIEDRCQVVIVVADWWSDRAIGIPYSICYAYPIATAFVSSATRIAVTRPSSDYAISGATLAYNVRRSTYGHDGPNIGYRPVRSEHNRRNGMIMYMSVDALLEEMVANADLSSYSAVIIDDAHARTLSTDLLLGMLLSLARRRPRNLHIVLTVPLSAQHEASKLSAFFAPHCSTKTIVVPRASAEPAVLYVQPEPEYEDPTEAALTAALAVHRNEPPGRVLLFLGCDSGTVDRACGVLRQRIACSTDPEERKAVVFPMHHGHFTEFLGQVNEAYAADPVVRENIRFQRWILVLSQDVPDSAVETLGAMYVVDPGVGKGGIQISKQAADERASQLIPLAKAGRNPKCFRLYRESVYRDEMIPTTLPEILTCSSEALSVAATKMMRLGITDPWAFQFIDQPPCSKMTMAPPIDNAALPNFSTLNL